MESLGKYLKNYREEMGITLEEIERVTKINLTYLKDLEEEKYDLLPAPIFTVGFLKQYARCIGLDPEDVVLRYRLAVQGGEVTSEETSGPTSLDVRKKTIWILVGSVCGLIILWIMLYPGSEPKERVRSIRLPRSSLKEISQEIRKEELKKELDLSPDGAVGSAFPGSVSTEERENSSIGIGGIGSGEIVPVALTLQALSETWIQMTVDDGPSLERILKPGERYSCQAEEKIQLKIGNGDGVRIFYDGKVYENLGKKGDVVYIEFPPPKS